LTVTLGKANVGVDVMVGDNAIVGVDVMVGSEVTVRVGVNVASGVSVNVSVAVTGGIVGVACCSVEGAQAETKIKINKMILYTFIWILLTSYVNGDKNSTTFLPSA